MPDTYKWNKLALVKIIILKQIKRLLLLLFGKKAVKRNTIKQLSDWQT